MRTCSYNLILRERNMKNKTMIPIIIGAVIILAAAIFFMQGGDKTAKKGGDSAQPIIYCYS